MEYSHPEIIINDREVSLGEILLQQCEARSEFETSTFRFIRQWLSHHDDFHLQTSGSTGVPKEIRIRRSQMEANASSTIKALRLSSEDSALVCLDTNFIAGKMMLVRAFMAGMRIIARDPSANPLHNVGNHPISFTAMVPLQVEHLLKTVEKNRLNSIRNVLVGGAAVSEEIIHLVQDMECHVICTYGMTETISHIALRRVNGPRKQDAFETLPGVTVEADQRGCLIVNAFYLDRPLVTNDLVTVINTTSFIWLGRYDNVINSGGIKVSPEAVEQMLERLKPALNLHGRFVISGINDRRLGERVVWVIEGTALDIERPQRLLEFVYGNLPKFHAPTEIIFIPAFPETKTGKINRTAIKLLLNSRV